MSDSANHHPEPVQPREGLESRRYPRESPAGLRLSKPVPARIVDIGALGLGLETTDSLVPLSQHRFTIEVGQAQVSVLGEVRWCRQVDPGQVENGDSTPLYRSGVALLETAVLS